LEERKKAPQNKMVEANESIYGLLLGTNKSLSLPLLIAITYNDRSPLGCMAKYYNFHNVVGLKSSQLV
jgi:hypothetical protein